MHHPLCSNKEYKGNTAIKLHYLLKNTVLLKVSLQINLTVVSHLGLIYGYNCQLMDGRRNVHPGCNNNLNKQMHYALG